MPTYDYECSACGHVFEKSQPITAKPIRTCPKCKSRSLKRLIGAGAGVIFKGSGFHQTDYRSEAYNKAAKSETCSACPMSADCKDKSTTPKKTDGDKKD